jgi:hypothetical protein
VDRLCTPFNVSLFSPNVHASDSALPGAEALAPVVEGRDMAEGRQADIEEGEEEELQEEEEGRRRRRRRRGMERTLDERRRGSSI